MRRVALALVASFGLTACSNILGLDDYFDAFDGSSDGAVGSENEAGTDAPSDGPCSKVDCSDPACMPTHTCAPPLPNGWLWTAYAAKRPACASGYTAPTDVEEGIVAPPATCGCGCATSNPSCTTGNLTVTAGTSGGNGCEDQANQLEPATGGCQDLTPAINSNNWSFNVKGPTPSGGSCTPAATTNKGPVSFGFDGRTCALTANVGGGCAGSDVCVAKAAPFSICVVKLGDALCPSGFPFKHTVGTVVTDGRGCSSCSCTLAAGTCGGTMTLYDDPNCTKNATPIAVDGACHAAPKKNLKTYVYAPQTTASCTSSQVSATGSATFVDARTICCVN